MELNDQSGSTVSLAEKILGEMAASCAGVPGFNSRLWLRLQPTATADPSGNGSDSWVYATLRGHPD